MDDNFKIKDNNYFTVSQIGHLFGVSVQTLHHYDRLDILKPEKRDPNNNYRRYRFDQIYQLASIRFLRKMNVPLDDIRRYLDNRTPDSTMSLLENQLEELEHQWKALLHTYNAIERKIQFVREKLRDLDVSSIEIRELPERRYIPIGHEEKLYTDDSFYFYPTLVLYQGDDRLFGAYVSEEDVADTQVTTDRIPAGRYLIGYHRGFYETIGESFSRIRAAAPECKVADWLVAQNIVDQFVQSDRSEYITEIQMPIL